MKALFIRKLFFYTLSAKFKCMSVGDWVSVNITSAQLFGTDNAS